MQQLEAGWPKAVGEAARHGLPGAIVATILPQTEADEMALLIQLLVGVGNAVGHGPHFKVGRTTHHTNEFATLVGDSAKSRKGTSWDDVESLLRPIDEVWATTRVQSGLSSAEGLAYHVRDAGERMTSGRLVPDPGVTDKRLLVREAEFAAVLRVMARKESKLSPVIRNAWDGKPLQDLVKHNPVIATNAHVSIVAHVTAGELRQTLPSLEAANGFGNRFLWVAVRRSKLLPDGGHIPAEALEPLVKQLKDAVGFARTVGEVKRDEEATALWHEVYPELSKGEDSLVGHMTARAEAHVVRLSLIYALLDMSQVVRREHLEAALAVWLYCEASARCIFAGLAVSKVERMATQINEALGEAGRLGLTRTEISGLFNRNATTPEIDAALDHLKQRGLARIVPGTGGVGRPSERWAAVCGTV